MSSTPTYTLSTLAYAKLTFHASKHPHKPVNGILLGKSSSPNAVSITDTIPLLHHWTSLSPMMEVGLDVAKQYVDQIGDGIKVVGYYQASERVDDTALGPVGEKVAGKVKAGFGDAIVFVIDGTKLGSEEVALVPYLSSQGTWKPHTATFSSGSKFTLSSPDAVKKVREAVTEKKAHLKFGDFDDHLEDVSIGLEASQTRVQDITSLFNVPIPPSQSPQSLSATANKENTIQAIAFPANEDTPRLITIDCNENEPDSIPWQDKHIRHLFRTPEAVRERYVHQEVPHPDVPSLPDDRCLDVYINDDSLQDGSPLNRCIFGLTEGKCLNPWSDNVVALRQRPRDRKSSRYGSANLEEDLKILKNYFLMQGWECLTKSSK